MPYALLNISFQNTMSVFKECVSQKFNINVKSLRKININNLYLWCQFLWTELSPSHATTEHRLLKAHTWGQFHHLVTVIVGLHEVQGSVWIHPTPRKQQEALKKN